MSPERLSFEALGGRCELLAVGPTHLSLDEGARWVTAMHARLTRFDEASELSRFNATAGRWVEVSPELEALVGEALRAYALSDGLVHAGVLGRMAAIGYARSFERGPTTLTAPAPEPLAPLPELLAIAPGRARLAPGAGIDLGGIAKGWLADRLAERLGENVVVNLAGDLFARGGGPAGEGWPVGVGGVTALLRDSGAATSGTSVRRWGDRLHHLVDPRTGLPAETDLREVSVVASSATDAEIYAKAALLLGAARAADYLMPRALGWWLT